MGNEGQSKDFVTKLIVQGLLMLLEKCLKDAEAEYAKVIKNQTGADKSCKLTIDESQYLPEECLGGVVLMCQNGKIAIDNTIDLRLKLVMEQDKPAIRGLLFPSK